MGPDFRYERFDMENPANRPMWLRLTCQILETALLELADDESPERNYGGLADHDTAYFLTRAANSIHIQARITFLESKAIPL